MARILVLEDEALIAMMLSDWLAELGHQTIGPACSTADAFALLESNTDIDGALLDVSVNDGTSTPVAVALDAIKVPFAFTTGHGAAGVPAPFAHKLVVSKPFEFEAFEHVISRLLSQSNKTCV